MENNNPTSTSALISSYLRTSTNEIRNGILLLTVIACRMIPAQSFALYAEAAISHELSIKSLHLSQTFICCPFQDLIVSKFTTNDAMTNPKYGRGAFSLSPLSRFSLKRRVSQRMTCF
jgi:hypothetical protein